VARRFTHLSFVVDHIAKPRIAAGPDPEWEEGMRPLADLENVTVKVSGMVTEAEWKSWKPADLAPFVQSVKGWFGPERLLFGSDWPVCLVAAEYSRVLSALLEALGDVTAGEREAILGENARRIYRLGAEA
jgi:L-fuconolactonase